jgi:NDP-sugar pyrophosphorylase family protein
MQVVILAGGKGTRLRPLTDQTPKPLMCIHGKPFLEYQLELIRSAGLKNVLLLVSYLGDRIEEYFDDGSQAGLNIKYSYEKEPMGTGGALKNAEDKLEEEFLLLNGDTFLPIDYGKLMEYFQKNTAMGMITAYDNHDEIVPNNIRIEGSNLVAGYSKKDHGGKTHVDAGAVIFRKKIVDLIKEGQICSLEEEIFPELIQMKELMAFPTSQRFYDMGNLAGLKLLEEILK